MDDELSLVGSERNRHIIYMHCFVAWLTPRGLGEESCEYFLGQLVAKYDLQTGLLDVLTTQVEKSLLDCLKDLLQGSVFHQDLK